MNYSDYDSDGYSSNDDKDYVPSDDNLSEDDINECEGEEPLHVGDDVTHPDPASKKRKKKKPVVTMMRKRKSGVLTVEAESRRDEEETSPLDANEANDVNEANDANEANKANKAKETEEVKQKKKSDELWASFLSDVGSRPKDSKTQDTADSSESDPQRTTTPEAAKVTITKVFDFAGEEVRVQKEVSADSREAKSFLKMNQKNEKEEKNINIHKEAADPGPSMKRPAGVSSLLNRLGGKKQKMSTLEKSKMDWDAFKSEEGISEELEIHNRGKDGYVERKNFLERVDHRQFELEKMVRLNNMKQ